MDVKIKNKTPILIAGIVLLQILILINLPTANSFLINQANSETQTIIKEDENKLVGKGLGILISLLSIKQIGSVSAELWNTTYGVSHSVSYSQSLGGSVWNCCPLINDGAICQDVPRGFGNCSENLFPTECKQVADCKQGCCIDTEEGLCTTRSTKLKCEQDGGSWEEGEECSITECQKGCCVIGKKVEFVTEQRCSKISGSAKDFRDLNSEISCYALQENQDYGACILNEEGCKFTTEIECATMLGQFSESKLCSSVSANCVKQASIGCVEGKDEIYWLDSCGNMENIYSSNKEDSWNDGNVLTKSESCNTNSANINSATCGNCNFMLGSKCQASSLGKKVEDGNFICADVNCVDEKGVKRKNGESWCIYDSFIGEGKDTVGSRHWKQMCIDGEIKAEPCADYRGQICVQGEITKENSNEKFTSASCVINDAIECINSNQNKETMQQKCEENTNCMIKQINIDDGFKFDMCVGKYPRGFDLTGQIGGETSKQICNIASQTCIVLYEKKISGWECVFNCDCETKKFGEQMNDLCISLGDCGAYVNYLGEGTNSIKIKKSPKVSWEDYKNYSEVVSGKVAEPKNPEDILTSSNEANVAEAYLPEEGFLSQSALILGAVSGAGGLFISGLGWAFGKTTILTAGQSFSSSAGYTATPMASGAEIQTQGAVGGQGLVGPQLQALQGALAGVGIGMTVGTIVNFAFGLQGDAALAVTISGALAGGLAGFGATAYGTAAAAATAQGASAAAAASAGSSAAGGLGGVATFGGALGPMLAAFVWAAIIAVAVAVVMKVMGIGETKEVEVTFDCLPWKAPTGADNCAKCNEDPLKPCTEYRCTSLGQACQILNTESENPICVEKYPNDYLAPKITPTDTSLGYKFQNSGMERAEIRTSENECIPEFTPVFFSFETDKYAQCRFDFNKDWNVSEEGEYFLEGNSFVINHTGGFMMPSLRSLEIYNLSGDIKEMFGDIDMFVRCQDEYGNYNKNPYTINFCVKTGNDTTPAYITSSTPRNTASIKYNLQEVPLTIYLSEPAECKYDLIDKEYDVMLYEMDCKTNVTDYEKYGWPCSATLNALGKKQNDFYIRCKDQPWEPEINDSIRNVNNESFVFTLYSSNSELGINSVSPQGKITGGFEPVSVTLKVETSGGVNNGKASCYYRFSEEGRESQFLETFSNKHQQVLTSMLRGNYNVLIRCEDEAGNEATNSASFSIDIDTFPPIVVRAYQENGKLKMITNEKAECYYSLERCSFDFENATSISTGFSTNHFINANPMNKYYVKCADTWQNKNPGCAIIVNPGFKTNQ